MIVAPFAATSMHHHGQALFHQVDSSRGLDDADFTVLDAWLRAR
ncbi:hypothetical protein ACFWOJ_29075 [Streptomyces sp. NPDC058439]